MSAHPHVRTRLGACKGTDPRTQTDVEAPEQAAHARTDVRGRAGAHARVRGMSACENKMLIA